MNHNKYIIGLCIYAAMGILQLIIFFILQAYDNWQVPKFNGIYLNTSGYSREITSNHD